MSEPAQQATEGGTRAQYADLQNQINQLRDALRHHVGDRLDDADDERRELEAELHAVHREVDTLRAEIESFTGPLSDKTAKEKRIRDLKYAMIKAARSNRDNGVNDGLATKHFHDVRDTLAELGHEEGLSKPSVCKYIKEIAESSQGFTKTEKPHRGGDGVTRDCLALQIRLTALPSHEASKGVTTADGVPSTDQPAETVTESTK